MFDTGTLAKLKADQLQGHCAVWPLGEFEKLTKHTDHDFFSRARYDRATV